MQYFDSNRGKILMLHMNKLIISRHKYENQNKKMKN
jgi:hypothetical protein